MIILSDIIDDVISDGARVQAKVGKQSLWKMFEDVWSLWKMKNYVKLKPWKHAEREVERMDPKEWYFMGEKHKHLSS